MATVQDVVRYLVIHYPYPSDLSIPRLTKLLFLADWFAALQYDHPITSSPWYFDHYGPYAPDVLDAVNQDPQLHISPAHSAFGGSQPLVQAQTSPLPVPSLTDNEQRILDQVITTTRDLSWLSFVVYVHHTYPLRSRPRHTPLPLVDLAHECRTHSLPS